MIQSNDNDTAIESLSQWLPTLATILSQIHQAQKHCSSLELQTAQQRAEISAIRRKAMTKEKALLQELGKQRRKMQRMQRKEEQLWQALQQLKQQNRSLKEELKIKSTAMDSLWKSYDHERKKLLRLQLSASKPLQDCSTFAQDFE